MKSDSTKLEKFKHELTIALEEKKWEFKKKELEYLEAGQHLRSLNLLLWQVPGMVIAITGGIWFGVLTVQNESARTTVLLFTFIVDLFTIVIIYRLRDIVGEHIKLQKEFNLKILSNDKEHSGKYIVVRCWTIVLVCAAIISWLGAVFPQKLNKNESDKTQSFCPTIPPVSETTTTNYMSFPENHFKKFKPKYTVSKCPISEEK